MSTKKNRNADKRVKKLEKQEQERRRKKRMPIIFGAVVAGIVLLGGGMVLSNLYDQTQQETADLYKNKITYSTMEKKVADKEEIYAYFYQPECEHCKIVSPVLIPMAESLGKPLYPVNIANNKEAWDKYKVQGTPTLIHFKDGKEVGTVVGEQPEATFRDFLTK